MTYLVLHTRSCATDGLAAALAEEGVDFRELESAASLAVDDRPAVCLLGPAERDAVPADRLATFVRDGGAVILLGRDGEPDLASAAALEGVSAWIPHPHPGGAVLLALRAALREAAARHDAWGARREASLRTRELAELTRIGMALSTERDYNTLLGLILRQALDITALQTLAERLAPRHPVHRIHDAAGRVEHRGERRDDRPAARDRRRLPPAGRCRIHLQPLVR